MYKIKILLLAGLLLFISFLYASEQNIYSKDFINKFGKLDGNQQMKFFNALNKQDRMNFIAEFMKDRSFDLPPTEVVKFYFDGEFIADGEAEESGMLGGNGGDKPYKYFIGKWYFKDGKIFIENLDPKNTIYGKYEIWDDVKIEGVYKKSATFIFHILKGLHKDGTDLTNKEDSLCGGVTDLEAPSGISPAIDSYTKLKQAKKK